PAGRCSSQRSGKVRASWCRSRWIVRRVTVYPSPQSRLSMVAVSIFRGDRGSIRSMVKKRKMVSFMTDESTLSCEDDGSWSAPFGDMNRPKADNGHQMTSGTYARLQTAHW